MISAVADTHTVIWYLYGDPRLSSTARTWIEMAATTGAQIALSSITLAEMVYLIEKGRIDAAVLSRLMAALDAADAVLVEVPFDRRVAERLFRVPRAEVPDLLDRIIAATALYQAVPIISRNHKIRTSNLSTVW